MQGSESTTVEELELRVFTKGEPPNDALTVTATQLPLRFHGSGRDLAALYLRNLVLSVLTLGFYAPWGRTAIRRYVWASLQVGDTRLRYHGTPRELLFGHVLWTIVISIYLLGTELLGRTVAVGGGVAFLLLWIYSQYASRAYQYSRTSWRGLRFGLAGSPVAWTAGGLVGVAAIGASLGILWPFLLADAGKRFVGDVRYGNARTTQGHDLTTRSLGWTTFFNALLIGPTLGLFWWRLKARLFNRLLADARLDNLRLVSTLRGRDLLFAHLLLSLGSLATLGLAYPWLKAEQLRFLSGKLMVEANGKSAAVAAPVARSRGVGDAIADGIDIGL